VRTYACNNGCYEGPIRRTRKGGSEWVPIKILLEGDRGSNKMNTASNTHLRLNYPSWSRPRSHLSATDARNQQTTFWAKTHQHAQRKLARLAACATPIKLARLAACATPVRLSAPRSPGSTLVLRLYPETVHDFILSFFQPCGPHLTPLATGSLEPSLLDGLRRSNRWIELVKPVARAAAQKMFQIASVTTLGPGTRTPSKHNLHGRKTVHKAN
jgi:hypothetical protein